MKFTLSMAKTNFDDIHPEYERLGFIFEDRLTVDYTTCRDKEDVKNGRIARYCVFNKTEIEINSLEELMNFIAGFGRVIIDSDINRITIYNDYYE